MASQPSGFPGLEQLSNLSTHIFSTPTKQIHDGDDLTFFLSSTGYRDLMTWLFQLNRSMFPTKDENGNIHECRLDAPPVYGPTVTNLSTLVSDLSDLIERAPPDTGPRRFGNVAFKTWYKLVEDEADKLLDLYLADVFNKVSDEQKSPMREELKAYFLGSLGSAQRLDYGTGHELSFLAFLGCLWKLHAFPIGEERAIVVSVIQPYFELIRRLVLTYTLEPAGSHGVWGLDDHSFLPYIFGSAQYGPAISANATSLPVPTEGSLKSAPSPSKVTNKELVAEYKTRNMYFSAIQFIYDVKKGPFWEHSPVLYDVSGIKDGWAKINKGMLKMFAAEVLGKFPVVQHFGLGSLFRWEADPEAIRSQASLHAQQQPSAAAGVRSMGVPPPPPPPGGAGTKAPWAGAGGGAAMPSTRAPWAEAGVSSTISPSAVPNSARGITSQRRAPGILPAASTSNQSASPDGSGTALSKAP